MYRCDVSVVAGGIEHTMTPHSRPVNRGIIYTRIILFSDLFLNSTIITLLFTSKKSLGNLASQRLQAMQLQEGVPGDKDYLKTPLGRPNLLIMVTGYNPVQLNSFHLSQ